MKPNRKSWPQWVVYGVGLTFGLACIIGALYALTTHRASVQWPVTQGQILQSELQHLPDDSRAGHHHHADRAQVTFRYQVNGTEYKSQQITLWSADLGWAEGMAEPFVTAHPPQSAVDVHYDPEHPEIAVLIPGANEKLDWLLFGAGGVCLLSAGWGFAANRRQQRLLRSLPDSEAIAGGFMTRAAFESATKAFKQSFLAAGGLVILAMACLLPSLMSGPGGLPGTVRMQPVPLSLGIVAGLAAAYFFRRAIAKGRSIECPNCHNLFRVYTRKTGRCEVCGVQAFSDMTPTTLDPN